MEPLSVQYIHKPSRTQQLFNERAKRTYESGNGTGTADASTTPRFPPSNENNRPWLVRKKSGEIVKPNLSKSLPTTPNMKQVHFGDAFDVKYFHKKDRPTAISASNSPDGSESEEEDSDYFSFGKSDVSHVGRQLHLPNFPAINYDRMGPVRLERLFIDGRQLVGHIAVKNVSFEKVVMVRYTFDGWQTIIEKPCEYTAMTPAVMAERGYDRFVFKVSMSKMVEPKYELCVRYTAPNVGEFWDNNNGQNYQIKFGSVEPVERQKEVAKTKWSSWAADDSSDDTSNNDRIMDSALEENEVVMSEEQVRNQLDSIRRMTINEVPRAPIRPKEANAVPRYNNLSRPARYSSSYLKRRSSDSNLLRSFSDEEDLKSLNKKEMSYNELVDRYCWVGKKEDEKKGEGMEEEEKKGEEKKGDGMTISGEIESTKPGEEEQEADDERDEEVDLIKGVQKALIEAGDRKDGINVN